MDIPEPLLGKSSGVRGLVELVSWVVAERLLAVAATSVLPLWAAPGWKRSATGLSAPSYSPACISGSTTPSIPASLSPLLRRSSQAMA